LVLSGIAAAENLDELSGSSQPWIKIGDGMTIFMAHHVAQTALLAEPKYLTTHS